MKHAGINRVRPPLAPGPPAPLLDFLERRQCTALNQQLLLCIPADQSSSRQSIKSPIAVCIRVRKRQAIESAICTSSIDRWRTRICVCVRSPRLTTPFLIVRIADILTVPRVSVGGNMAWG
ncbi:hypothetical protein F5Y10DRAFT_246624 [Nemania abortiva]|nr:hypothetical protein F5Y10DRAFT_246624 [Nemania abortiva]